MNSLQKPENTAQQVSQVMGRFRAVPEPSMVTVDIYSKQIKIQPI